MTRHGAFGGGLMLPRGKLAVGALLLACVSLLASALRAESVLPVPTAPGSDVNIKVALLSAQPPRFGFAPVRVSIENSAAQERSWRFQFQSGSRGTFPGPVAFERTITVPAGQTRDTWLYVPVAEPGTPGGNPILSSGGITAGAAPVVAPKVTINRTFGGTQIIKVTPITGAGGSITEDTTIDGTTGEMKTVTTSGGTSSTRTTSVPSGTAVTYRIDSGTGAVSRSFTPIPSTGIGTTPKVTILTDTTRGSGLPSTSTTITPTKVTVDPTPVGMKVTRILGTSGKTGRNYTEEREIDATTGVITTTMTSPVGTVVSSRATPPLTSGTETTFTINPTTGSIGTSTRIASNSSAPPKVTIVTGPATTGGLPISPASRFGATPGPRIVSSSFSGPPMQLSFEVSGPGLSGSNRLSFPSLGSTANMRPWGATLALERVLREGLNNEGVRTPNLAAVEVAQLPADWAVWSSFASLFMQADEFATLDAARRAALRGWVALGGQLYLSPSDPGQRTIEAIGAGTIMTLASPLATAPTAADLLVNGISLGGSPGHPDSDALLVRATSTLGDAIAEKETSSTWLTIFLLLFAGIIGPVNLYVFAPAAKRHRLFITTPLISLAAAIILGLTILGQDGAGGDGERRVLVVFVPGDNQAAVFQEQAARTGFLTGQSFALPADTQLTSLPLEDAAMGRINFNTTPDLVRDDARASGAWFRSRGRQAHLLQRLVPTRGRVERVGTAAGGAPIVQSSLPGVLRDFRVRR